MYRWYTAFVGRVKIGLILMRGVGTVQEKTRREAGKPTYIPSDRAQYGIPEESKILWRGIRGSNVSETIVLGDPAEMTPEHV